MQVFFAALQQSRSETLEIRRSRVAGVAAAAVSEDPGPGAGKIRSSMNKPIEKPRPLPRSAYRMFRPLTTRWMDNDVYGHVNNVVYYSWFDTAVNAWLIEQGVLDIHGGETIGLVIETQCNYFAPLAFPQTVEAGIRVAQLGHSSVRYEVGLYTQGEEFAAAQGHFVHVYVDRLSRRPAPLAASLRAALQTLI